MNCIVRREPGILWYGACHFNPESLKRPDTVLDQIYQDLADSGVSVEELASSKLVIDTRAEGHDHHNLEQFVKCLRDLGVKQFTVLFGAIVDTDSLDYDARCDPMHLSDGHGFFSRHRHLPLTFETDCKFLCLMRSLSHARARFASAVLESQIDVRLSFGAAHPNLARRNFQIYFSKNARLPLLVDGLLPDSHGAASHDIGNDLFRTCAVNIVVESSSQNERGRWSSIFITEKTYKAFAMAQLPIWFAVPGLVAEVRKLGFDVFDDVINHDYDHIVHEETRMQVLIDEIQRLSNMNIVGIRHQLRDRLVGNFNHLANIVDTQAEKNYETWQRLIDLRQKL
jgi:hypothetical protein